MLVILALFVVILSLFIWTFLWRKQNDAIKSAMVKNNPKIVFVTAHPDDECMFFGPSIQQTLKLYKDNVFLVCLSSGSYSSADEVTHDPSLAKTRQAELVKAANVLGFKRENVQCLDIATLRDGPNEHWQPVEILKNLKDTLFNGFRFQERDHIVVVTFDERGVSGHPNHCAISRALMTDDFFKDCFVLYSVPNPIKFMSLLALPWIMLFQGHSMIVVSNWQQFATSFRAMLCHKSQLLWFRYLYLSFSSFIYVNVLLSCRQRKKGKE